MKFPIIFRNFLLLYSISGIIGINDGERIFHMAGSSFGNLFRITTWGESHGKALGVVIDGCPAGLPLNAQDIQVFLDRRKPGKTAISTPRREADEAELLSGVFEGRTTGAPISLLIPNTSQKSSDYSEIASYYRPGHADYTYDKKFGFRDYRGGGRASARETAGRVAAGAIASKLLKELGITVTAYTKSIGPVHIDMSHFDRDAILSTATCMPDRKADAEAAAYLKECMRNKDSAGGVVECVVTGMPAGIGDPVFDKLDAGLARAIMSIGAVKAVEIGDGFAVSGAKGSENNDAFAMHDGRVVKKTNHAGGILGGISDGTDIVLRAHFKPTPSIFQRQETVNKNGENMEVEIKGRHDPVVVPRAVVVVECMTALTVLDACMTNMSARLDYLTDFYHPSDSANL